MGFVAGTLVHTDKGLVPIEQLKVGDRVLSKPESGEGELAYKLVVKTFKSKEKQKIIYINYQIFDDDNDEELGERFLFCTEEHPFHVKNYWEGLDLGWLPAVDLSGSNHGIETVEHNKLAIVMPPCDDYYDKTLGQSAKGEIARMLGYGDAACALIDFRGKMPRVITRDNSHLLEKDSIYQHEAILDLTNVSNSDIELLKIYELVEEVIDLGMPYKSYCYSLEVTDYHTYFVGKCGILVAAQKQTT